MDCSNPSFLALHYLPRFAQTHVHWVGDAIQPSHLPFPPSPPTLNFSQHRDLFQQVNSSGGQSIGTSASASILPVNIQDCFSLGLTGLILLSRDSQETSLAPQFKSLNFLVLSLLYGPTLTSEHDYWKKLLYSFDYIDLCWQSDVSAFNTLSRFVIVFLPRSKHLLIL